MTANCTFWDTVPDQFLADDRNNPARAAAAAILLEHARKTGLRSLLEVGPGMGFDFADHFQPHVVSKDITYQGVEGSTGLHSRLQQQYPVGDWVLGTFDDLTPASYDMAYTKATLEHQGTLEAPLVALLQAARSLVVINWYRPPGLQQEQVYQSKQQVWYTTWRQADVLEVIARFGTCEIQEVPGSTNVLYIVRKTGVTKNVRNRRHRSPPKHDTPHPLD